MEEISDAIGLRRIDYCLLRNGFRWRMLPGCSCTNAHLLQKECPFCLFLREHKHENLEARSNLWNDASSCLLVPASVITANSLSKAFNGFAVFIEKGYQIR
jgi:hypothetical protein